MIGRLRGTLLEKAPGLVLIEAAGVGYEVDIPYTTFFHLPEIGATVTLHTHFAVREDAQSLFGFVARLDRDLFRLLIKVNGVGPRLALAILSGLEPSRFVQCVERADTAALVKIPGVGKKTAERLLIDMRDRIKQLSGMPDTVSLPLSPGAVQRQDSSAVDEAEAALISLGYKPQEASRAISQVAEEGMSSQEIIRQALRSMIPAG
ncbi:Holliday junction branch migration protein RuvA [Mangrovitalea sediminis]|uniref:Holliday junction branch migration protein RuvA n=1 Tax=Mangrovitalea sediminis TaxID=1982043 RepID=UPI000BE4B51C|nr:Holliday junction branch migration protein RuvA [Mangrovitalea sediminis]